MVFGAGDKARSESTSTNFLAPSIPTHEILKGKNCAEGRARLEEKQAAEQKPEETGHRHFTEQIWDWPSCRNGAQKGSFGQK